MNRILLTAALVLAAHPVAAQTDYYARLGATYSTAIVRDVIFEPITTKPGIAPTLFLGTSLPMGNNYRVGFEAALSHASLTATSDSTGSSTDVGSITNASGVINLEGTVHPRLHWHAGVGLLMYSPSDDASIFGGERTSRALVMVGADYRAPVLRAWDVMISTRYDFHRFTTDELRRRGFALEQAVHRLSLSAGLARSLP